MAIDPRGAFVHPSPPTVGIEEELMVLDPVTLDLTPRAPGLVARAGGDPGIATELPAAQVELRSRPRRTVAEAAADLARGRADLVRLGAGEVRLAGAGAHPFAAAEGEVTPGPRYLGTLREFGAIARRQLVFGLHVHVAVRPADRALAVHDALRSHLPELAALAANAPFHAGRDTGLASVRPTIAGLLPRQGVPPPARSWEALEAALRWGAAAGAVADPASWWWELRLNARTGTVEVRVPDAQASVADAAAVAAVIHALTATLAARHEAGEALPVAETWRIAENRWWACRDGVGAHLADLETGRREPARERLHRLIDAIAPAARELGCAEELEAARGLVERDLPGRWRAVAADRGSRGLVGWLADRFLPGRDG